MIFFLSGSLRAESDLIRDYNVVAKNYALEEGLPPPEEIPVPQPPSHAHTHSHSHSHSHSHGDHHGHSHEEHGHSHEGEICYSIKSDFGVEGILFSFFEIVNIFF